VPLTLNNKTITITSNGTVNYNASAQSDLANSLKLFSATKGSFKTYYTAIGSVHSYLSHENCAQCNATDLGAAIVGFIPVYAQVASITNTISILVSRKCPGHFCFNHTMSSFMGWHGEGAHCITNKRAHWHYSANRYNAEVQLEKDDKVGQVIIPNYWLNYYPFKVPKYKVDNGEIKSDKIVDDGRRTKGDTNGYEYEISYFRGDRGDYTADGQLPRPMPSVDIDLVTSEDAKVHGTQNDFTDITVTYYLNQEVYGGNDGRQNRRSFILRVYYQRRQCSHLYRNTANYKDTVNFMNTSGRREIQGEAVKWNELLQGGEFDDKFDENFAFDRME